MATDKGPSSFPNETLASTSVQANRTVEVFLITAASLTKVEPVVRRLAKQRSEGARITVLCGRDGGTRENLPDDVRIVVRPESDVFSLRAYMPQLFGEDGWIAILEDHNDFEGDWLAKIHRKIAQTPDHVVAIQGSIKNSTSTGRWSWASFLHTFAFSWHPQPSGKPALQASNLLFRASAAGQRALDFGAFESQLLPKLAAASQRSTDFPVDHIQHYGFATASAAHFHNGRVTGAIIRRNDGRRRRALRHAKTVVLGRFALLSRAVRLHPASADLPAGTLIRIYWLAVCHSLGACVGALAGAGDSAAKLE